MMRAMVVLFAALAVGSLGACKEGQEKAQADISKGNPDGGISKKRYEAAQKEAAEKRKEAQ
jgi:hypothetical protein